MMTDGDDLQGDEPDVEYTDPAESGLRSGKGNSLIYRLLFGSE